MYVTNLDKILQLRQLHFTFKEISLGIDLTLLIIYKYNEFTILSKLTMFDSHTSLFYDYKWYFFDD